VSLSRALERDAHQYTKGGNNVQRKPSSAGILFPFGIAAARAVMLTVPGASEQVSSMICPNPFPIHFKFAAIQKTLIWSKSSMISTS
jgi:hypothetical protein